MGFGVGGDHSAEDPDPENRLALAADVTEPGVQLRVPLEGFEFEFACGHDRLRREAGARHPATDRREVRSTASRLRSAAAGAPLSPPNTARS